jgi:hypothetical protein
MVQPFAACASPAQTPAERNSKQRTAEPLPRLTVVGRMPFVSPHNRKRMSDAVGERHTIKRVDERELDGSQYEKIVNEEKTKVSSSEVKRNFERVCL